MTIKDDRLTQAIRNVADDGEIGFMDKMGAYLNWGQFLTPIPKCLGVLATLLMTAGQTDDFSLSYENKAPIGGYRYMQNPHSFRQTLLQISQGSYEAFLTAHSNMNKIRLSMKTIPDYLKMAINILVTGNTTLIQQQIQPPLEIVKTSIEDNLAWSSEMVDRFDKLSNLTDEIRLAAVASSKDRTDRRMELVDQQETKKLTADNHKQLINNLDQSINKDFSRHFQAVDDLVEAHKSMPTAIESFFMDVGAFFVQFSVKNGSQQEETSNNSTEEVTEPPPDDPCLHKHRNSIFFIFARSHTMLEKYSVLSSIDSAKFGKYNATKHMDEFATHLTNTSQCKPIRSLIQLGNNTIQMMHQLAEETPDNCPDCWNVNETLSKQEREDRFQESRQNKFLHVRNLMEKFHRAAQKLRDVALNPPKSATTKSKVKLSLKSTASEQAKANAEYKIAIYTEELSVLHESIDRNLNLTIRNTEESISILNEMHSWKAEEMSMDRAIEILRIGTIELADLKETWSRLVTFFGQISNLIEVISSKSLEDFNKHIESTFKSTTFQQRAKLKKYVIEAIRDKLSKANQASTIVHNMASSYYNVSNEYLMPRIQEMDTKMRFDSSLDMVKERNLLLSSIAHDEFQIGQLVAQDMRFLNEKVEQRQSQIKREFAFLDETEG